MYYDHKGNQFSGFEELCSFWKQSVKTVRKRSKKWYKDNDYSFIESLCTNPNIEKDSKKSQYLMAVLEIPDLTEFSFSLEYVGLDNNLYFYVDIPSKYMYLFEEKFNDRIGSNGGKEYFNIFEIANNFPKSDNALKKALLLGSI